MVWVDPTRLFAEILIEIAERDENVVLVTADSCDVTGAFNARFPKRSSRSAWRSRTLAVSRPGSPSVESGPLSPPLPPSSRADVTSKFAMTSSGQVSRWPSPARAGMSYSTGGPTHNAIDDMGLLRALPGMIIVDPGDLQDFRSTMWCAAELDRPIYFRKHKPLVERLNPEGYDFKLGKGVVLREGNDVTIVGCGPIAYQALLAAEILANAAFMPVWSTCTRSSPSTKR